MTARLSGYCHKHFLIGRVLTSRVLTSCALISAACALAFGALAPSPVLAQALPSFDCAKSQTAVEKLICGNAVLATLDRETARLFDLAKNSGSETQRGELIAAQRQWIGKRNDCASSTDKLRCVSEAFVQRISVLREQYPAARKPDGASISIGPFTASCENSGEPVTVTFVNSDPAFAYMEWPSNFVVLKQAMSGSGALYEAQYPKGQSRLWNKGNNAAIAFPGGKDMNCTLKPMT
jgi:uncharacterized protein